MMTAHYAKVDFGLLSEIAQPWPLPLITLEHFSYRCTPYPECLNQAFALS